MNEYEIVLENARWQEMPLLYFCDQILENDETDEKCEMLLLQQN